MVCSDRRSNWRFKMSRKCQVNGKTAQTGNNVSHAHNKTRKTWNVNLHKKRLFNPETGKWVVLKLSTRALRTVTKRGLSEALKEAV